MKILDKIAKIVMPNIRSGYCGFPQKRAMTIDVFPSEVRDLVGKCVSDVAIPITDDDAIGFKSLDDAITGAEMVCSRVLEYVEPQNLFLVFSEDLQAILHAFFECKSAYRSLYPYRKGYEYENGEKYNNSSSNHGAVIFFKLMDSKDLDPFFGKKHYCRTGCKKGYKVSWCELQELKERFYRVNHATMVADGVAKGKCEGVDPGIKLNREGTV